MKRGERTQRYTCRYRHTQMSQSWWHQQEVSCQCVGVAPISQRAGGTAPLRLICCETCYKQTSTTFKQRLPPKALLCTQTNKNKLSPAPCRLCTQLLGACIAPGPPGPTQHPWPANGRQVSRTSTLVQKCTMTGCQTSDAGAGQLEGS